MRRLALPAGVVLFILGLFYAGVPYSAHRGMGTTFGLLPETLTVIGIVFFIAGAILMITGRHHADFRRRKSSLWEMSRDMDAVKHMMQRKAILQEASAHVDEYRTGVAKVQGDAAFEEDLDMDNEAAD